MPTVLRSGSVRVVVYLNDHLPAHVHVLGPDWAVVINLIGPTIREAIGCGRREARQALQLVMANQENLIGAWRAIHG